MFRRGLVVGAVLAVVVATATGAQVGGVVGGLTPQAPPIPPRDRPAQPQTGTAAITGRVIDAATGSPVARARVRLQGQGVQRPVAITDAGGDFAFTNLPAGSYSLSAEKASYLPGRYPDATRSIRKAARPLTIGDGQVVEGLNVSLFRGAVIAGRVVDAYGDPTDQTEVRAIRLGRSSRTPISMSSSTNDLGEFRIPRLPAGTYVVTALPRNMRADDGLDVQLVPTFYPGVLTIDQAQPLKLERGESITGLDLVMVEATTTIVTGTVISAKGIPVSSGATTATGDWLAYVNARFESQGFAGGSSAGGASVQPDGTFRLKLAPGDYVLEVHAGASGPGRSRDEQYGRTRLTVAGEGMTAVTLVVGGGARVAGRLIFEGNSPLPSNPTQLHLSFSSREGSSCRSGRGGIDANWTFSFDGLFGTCFVSLSSAGRWIPKAVLHEGKNLMSHPIELDTGQNIRDIQVVFTDRRGELSFQVVDDRGQPTQEYVAIVFPADKTLWTMGAGYIRQYTPPVIDQKTALTASARPGATATISTTLAVSRREMLANLPPMDYYVIAIDDLDPEELYDPAALLGSLVSSAVRVKLTDGGRVDVPLRRVRLRGRQP